MLASPKLVTAEGWKAAHAALLVKEKALTRAQDELAAQRRRLPWLLVNKSYRFNCADVRLDLAALFDGRRQLIVYHHMLKPADPAPCTGCCMFTDNIGHLAHLHARDTSLVLVSRAPIAEIDIFKARMSWTIPWYETQDDFNADFGVTGGFGLNVFIKDGDDIFRTYFTSGRGVERLGSVWTFLDLTPLGRQETWEDSPAGAPQSAPYQWWRLHDSYAPASRPSACCNGPE